LRPFQPLVRNPDALTLGASFWPRRLDERLYPVEARLFQSEPGVQVLVQIQNPRVEPVAEAVLVHGLEGSSESVYMRSMAQTLLDAGCVVHRLNLRTCGGTEFLCTTLYHAGLVTDLFAWLTELDRLRRTPVFVVGFSLGGNVALKLVGEMGDGAARILSGVAAVSTPIDLAACTRRMGEPRNRVYEWHFLRSMKRRIQVRRKILDGTVDTAQAVRAASIWEFDDRITAPAFGFRGAAHYYETQSSGRYLDGIRVPAVLFQAIDDPFIPFEVYDHPAFERNPRVTLAALRHGGHIGFISRSRPRFWIDEAVRDWILGEEGNE
jgi:predicted alpha/beta-fold hydrolase